MSEDIEDNRLSRHPIRIHALRNFSGEFRLDLHWIAIHLEHLVSNTPAELASLLVHNFADRTASHSQSQVATIDKVGYHKPQES